MYFYKDIHLLDHLSLNGLNRRVYSVGFVYLVHEKRTISGHEFVQVPMLAELGHNQQEVC